MHADNIIGAAVSVGPDAVCVKFMTDGGSSLHERIFDFRHRHRHRHLRITIV